MLLPTNDAEVETNSNVQAYKEKINDLTAALSEKNQQIKELKQRVCFLLLLSGKRCSSLFIITQALTPFPKRTSSN